MHNTAIGTIYIMSSTKKFPNSITHLHNNETISTASITNTISIQDNVTPDCDTPESTGVNADDNEHSNSTISSI